MDNMIYSSLMGYQNALEKLGYMPSKHSEKLLVLCFLRDFVYNDYRGILSKEDYYQIEKALNCLYGTTCLIPYPDYLKMGKLHLGETTEMAHRLKELEETKVMKVIHNIADVDNNGSDVMIYAEED